MDPRDVNRINYNNYYVGQNLDFLIRSKMRSESLSTPLTNTPVFYDDQVSSKMALLGKRGFYDPGYIYGFDNQKIEKREIRDINQNSQSPPKYPPYNINDREREQYLNNQNNRSPPKYPPYNINEGERELNLNNQNQKDNISQEQYEMEMRRLNELERNKINNEQFDKRNNNINLRDRDLELMKERSQYDNRDFPNENEMRQRNYLEQNIKNNDYSPNEDFQREYKEYLNKDYNMGLREPNNINVRENNNDLNLPKTREQIQHDVYIENFKRQQLAKQMMMEDEMKYKEKYYK